MSNHPTDRGPATGAYDAGMRAFFAGIAYELNPYPEHSFLHLYWSRGHNAARVARALDGT